MDNRVCTVAIFGLASVSSASIISVSGMAKVVNPPSSLQVGAFENNSFAHVMFENKVMLPPNFEVDITQPGFYDQLSDLTPGIFPPIFNASPVHSFIVHADGVGTALRVFEGSITFDRDILGIMTASGRLINTDQLLAASGTSYSTNPARGVEFGTNAGPDTIGLSPNRRTVNFRLSVENTIDEFRIITTSIPSPMSLAVVGLGLIMGRRR